MALHIKLVCKLNARNVTIPKLNYFAYYVAYFLAVFIFLIFLYQTVGQSDNRFNRRQRILSILESYYDRPEPTGGSLSSARYQFSGGRSGGASDRVSLTHYSSGWGGGREPAERQAPPATTVEPPESPYDLWYYQDDSNYTQGPFSSNTMLEWQKAGYFRFEALTKSCHCNNI